MPDGRKIVELGEEIQKLPGYDIFFHHIKGLDLSRYIFDKNFQDLSAILSFVTVDPRGERLHLEENRIDLNAFGYEVACRLHNYVAAAETLVSHSRALYKRLCKRDGLFLDYQSKIDTDFTNDPLSGFIQEFRNYFLHDQPPKLTFITTYVCYGDEWKPVRKVCILLSHLYEKKDWKGRSRVFLESLTEDLDILALAESYKLKVAIFQDWFRNRLIEIFREDLKLLEEKQANLRKLYEEP